MPKKSEYQQRKAEGKCVRAGCKITPKKGPDGKRRSYCPYHTEQNAKNSAAWVKRQAAKKKSHKRPTVIRHRKVTPAPVALGQTA
jgi:hypothetical protein